MYSTVHVFVEGLKKNIIHRRSTSTRSILRQRMLAHNSQYACRHHLLMMVRRMNINISQESFISSSFRFMHITNFRYHRLQNCLSMKWKLASVIFIFFPLAGVTATEREYNEKQQQQQLRRRTPTGAEERGAEPLTNEEHQEEVIDEFGDHRNLLAVHALVESNFLVRNEFGLTTADFAGGFTVEPYLLDPYVQVANSIVDSLSHVKYVEGMEGIVAVVDTPCTTNCRAISSSSKCQRITAAFEIGIHPFHPQASSARNDVELLMDQVILVEAQLRTYLSDTANVVFSVQDSTQCTLGEADALVQQPIQRPLGKALGFQQTSNSDLGFRFNKAPMISSTSLESMPENLFPMTMKNYYPLPMEDATVLRTMTQAVSVFHPDDCLECDISVNDLIQASKVEITHPSTDPNSSFWDELWEVVIVQLHRIESKPAEELMVLPEIWKDLDIHEIAEAVHDEFPGIHHTHHLTQYLFGPGGLDKSFQTNCRYCARIDRSIIPVKSETEFIRGAVLLADLTTWAIGTVGPLNFATKWHVGRSRPEEVAWEIYNGRMNTTTGVPKYIVDTIQNKFYLEKMQDFTAYSEGSPNHPSWPAMHAAASAASLWMAVVMDLQNFQWCDAKALDYAIGYARTIAGVHYYTDTIAGLNLAQEILSRKLPGYLQERYGSDPNAVAAKIKRLRFDWNDYLASDCPGKPLDLYN